MLNRASSVTIFKFPLYRNLAIFRLAPPKKMKNFPVTTLLRTLTFAFLSVASLIAADAQTINVNFNSFGSGSSGPNEQIASQLEGRRVDPAPL